MADRIGPTSNAELVAAGVNLDGWGWHADGMLDFGASASAATQSAAGQVLAAHDPTRALLRSATTKQVRYALNALGVRVAWNTAVAASSQGGQDYWASSDPMPEDNAMVVKWNGAAGDYAQGAFRQHDFGIAFRPLRPLPAVRPLTASDRRR